MIPVRALRFAAWGNAVLRGAASPDEAVERIVVDDARHRVAGLPEEPGEVGLTLAFGILRRSGCGGLGVALPSAGDPVGLFGPIDFNSSAIAAGECVAAIGGLELGFVPEVTISDGSAFVIWRAMSARSERLTAAGSLADAERALDEALHAATSELARLDLARWDPLVAEDLARLRAGGASRSALAPVYPGRAHRVFVRAMQVDSILGLAQRSEGAAVSAAEMRDRTSALCTLGPATRRALMAAVNCIFEPARRDSASAGGTGSEQSHPK